MENIDNKIEEHSYEVEFLNCTVDKADDFKIIDSDSHFADFAGIHPSKIKQGKLFLRDILKPADRDFVFKKICKKNTKYVYIDFDILDKNNEPVFIHCSAKNYENSTLCRLVFADVSKSREKNRKLKEKATEANYLIDLVAGGVCLFKVTPEMHFDVIYMNDACCRLFGTTKESYKERVYRIDELMHPKDKTIVYQAIGRAMATGEPLDLEYRVMTHRDEFIWCKCNAAVQKYDEDGSPIFHAIFTDITRIKTAEKRADEANEKLINLLENLTGAIFFASLEKPFLTDYISGDFVRLIGYSRDEFEQRFGNDLSKLIGENSKELEKSIKAQVSKGGRAEITYKINARGARKALVRDIRKLVTQQDGTQTLICELEEMSNQ
ncbi:MAG: PAS domain-containing protein [Eubacterium sp.]|nr:PAS domain-containing protein [Eubacterium sp.]